MKRSSSQRLQDMMEYAGEARFYIDPYVHSKNLDALAKDRDTQLKLFWCITVIGEAAAGVSMEFRDMHPDIVWHSIIAMRNRLVHYYWDIGLVEVWEAAAISCPMLVSQLEAAGVVAVEAESDRQ